MCIRDSASSDKEQHYFVVIYHKSVADKVLDVLRKYAYSTAAFKDVAGTAAENRKAIDEKIASIHEKINSRSQEIASYAGHRENIQVCIDRSVQEMSREAAKEKLLSTDCIFSLEGWAATNNLDNLTATLSSYTCAWELADPEEDDEVPTLLENSNFIRPINMVTEMYSLPAYKGIDPNPCLLYTSRCV